MQDKSPKRPEIVACLAWFVPALACVGIAVPIQHPLVLLPLLLAQTLWLVAFCRALRLMDAATFPQLVWRRGGVLFLLFTVWILWVWLLTVWPLLALVRSPSLGATLLLSIALVAAMAPLWRLWPMFALVMIWDGAYPAGASSRILGAVRLSAGYSLQLTRRPEHLFSHLLPAGLGLLALAFGAAALAGFAGILPSDLRTLSLLLYGLVLLPLVALLVVNRTVRAIQADASDPGDAAEPPPDLPESMTEEELAPGARETALLAALRNAQAERALILLEAGADPDTVPDKGDQDQRSALHLATVLADTRVLRAMIGNGADLHRVHAGLSPLMAALRDSYHGRAEAVAMLVANGADIEHVDAEGNTALHHAARSADPGIAALLLDAGADIDACNRTGRSPLALACRAGNAELARFLLESGAATHRQGAEPALVAVAAAEPENLDLVQLLLKRRARVDACDALGRTALMTAALEGHVAVAEALLQAGAKVDAVDQRGTTALMEAARSGTDAMIVVLAGHKPDTECRDTHHRDALTLACQSPRATAETVRALLGAGADPFSVGGDRRSAIDHAEAAGRWDLVAVLDPTRHLPASHAAELAPEPGADSPAHLLDALRFGHWAVVSGFAGLIGEWPETERASLFLALAGAEHRLARRWLLDHGLDARAELADGRRLFDAVLLDLPASTEACGELLAAGADAAGAGWLAQAMARASASAGSAALLDALMERGADLFGADGQGRTPLHHAVAGGSHRLAAGLLERGCDPNVRDAEGSAPLHLALAHEDAVAERLVQLLLRHGGNPEAASGSGETPLGLSLERDNQGLVGWLRWQLWRLPGRPLCAADLPAAATVGDVDAVRRLLDLGFDIDSRDVMGATALLRAAGGGHAEIARLLLDRGADTSLAAMGGATALSAAVSARRDALVKLLLAHDVPVDQALAGGATALLVSAATGFPEVVAMLLEAGAAVGHVDGSGHTALHAACRYSFSSRDSLRARRLLDTLIAAGARPDVANARGAQPLLLLMGGHAQPGTVCDATHLGALLPVLLDAGAAPTEADQRGVTPLHACAMHALLGPARILLTRGADRQARDNRGRTAAEVARLLGYIDVAHELGSRDVPGASHTLRRPADHPES